MNDEAIVRDKQATEITGYGRSHRLRLEREGKFPQRRALGDRAYGYLKSDLINWVKNRPILSGASEKDPTRIGAGKPGPGRPRKGPVV